MLCVLTFGVETSGWAQANAASAVPISNVVFMGMGEPLNNYDNVIAACKAMVDPQLFGLAPGKVTVSTVGIIPRLKTLDADLPGVNLALSLHAPNQDLRYSIMPSARSVPSNLPLLVVSRLFSERLLVVAGRSH